MILVLWMTMGLHLTMVDHGIESWVAPPCQILRPMENYLIELDIPRDD